MQLFTMCTVSTSLHQQKYVILLNVIYLLGEFFEYSCHYIFILENSIYTFMTV
jgi:hypothetical protein